MARPRTTDLDTLLDVAEQLATAGDTAGLTLRRLAVEAGVSNGSIYHAFSSKEELLAQVWIRAARRLLTEQTARVGQAVGATNSVEDAEDVIVAAAQWPVAFAIERPAAARLFFGQRRDQLFSQRDLPAAITDELAAIQQGFTGLLVTLARARWQRTDRLAVERIAVCVVDIPGGLMQRKLVTGEGVSPEVATHVEAACRAILALELPPTSGRASRITTDKEASR